ncbi:MAG: glucokinase, partial [Thermoanaerobaculia bacterium]
MTENPDAPALVADIGGTHVRFALSAASGGLGCRQTLDCADFESPADAGESYLSGLQLGQRPRLACFAVASPVDGDRVEMTNQVWAFSVEETRRRLGLDRLE